MINVMEHFVTDFQEFKASTAEKIHKIERLLWENVTGHETVQTEYIKKQVELLQNENNRLRMELNCYQFNKQILMKVTTTQIL